MGLRRLARALDDLIGLLPGLFQPLPVFAQDLLRFGARALGGVDRFFDRLLAAFERLADTRERELGEQHHRDAEDEQRPNHQADARLDQEAPVGRERCGEVSCERGRHDARR